MVNFIDLIGKYSGTKPFPSL